MGMITGQVKVDKVFIETYRSGKLADDQLLEQVKKFFLDRGVEVAGGMGLTVNEANNFQSFAYTDPKDRAYVKTISERTARHFDEIILDDFYFEQHQVGCGHCRQGRQKPGPNFVSA